MKTILIYVLGISCLSFSFERGETELEQKGLKGKVKSVVEYEEVDQLNFGDSLKMVTKIYKFDQTGRKIIISYASKNKIYLKDSYVYANNRLVETMAYNRIYSRIRNIYDSIGKLTQDVYYNRREKVKNVAVYQYDSNGFLTGFISYDKKGRKLWSNAYTLDERGNRLIIYEAISSRKGLIPHKVYENRYDTENRLIEQIFYWREYGTKPTDTGIFRSMERYVYNDKGKIQQLDLYDIHRKFISSETYEWNQHGDISSSITRDKNGQITHLWTFTYLYDAQGNWISQRSYVGIHLIYINCRKIDYYE